MPNVGRPSRDCQACRQRRIKCDLIRPKCGQCLRKGIACPGYRDELVSRFRNETVSSFSSHGGKDQRRRRNREHQAYLFVESRHQRTSYVEQDIFLTLSAQHSALLSPLAESWDAHFFPFFMESVRPAHALSRDIYDVIPRVFAKADPSSALYQACNAVARMFLVRKIYSSKAIADEVTAHGTAIATIRSAIRNPQQFKSDNTILAIWFLGLCEFLHGRRNGTNSVVASSAWRVHNRVITDLIRLRGPEQFTRPEGRNLFLVIFSNVEIQAYMTGQEWKEAATWFLHFYRYCDPSEYPKLRTCIFCHHCSRLCGRIQLLLDAGESEKILSNVSSILQDVGEVENDTYPLSYEKLITDYLVDPPLVLRASPDQFDGQYCGGMRILQCTFRMRLSYHVLGFLRRASNLPGCTIEERVAYTQLQDHCIQEIISLANRALHISSSKPYQQSSVLQDQRDYFEGKKLPSVASLEDSMQIPGNQPSDQTNLSRTVKIYVDFERDPHGKSTLILSHSESGVSVTRLLFDHM